MEGPGIFIHGAIKVEHIYLGEVVTLADGKVVRVMVGRHFDRAGAEFPVNIGVGDDGNLPAEHRQQQHLADQMTVPRILRVHGDGGVAKDGLGAGGGHRHEAAAVSKLVAHMVQFSMCLGMLHLIIRYRRVTTRAPIDNVTAAINKAALIKTHKGLAHRP
ncbi:MAG: hypothetical protein DDT35_01148 [Firmicutes bacterium]|nr:hypothetical protein [Bacillota bacterium]